MLKNKHYYLTKEKYRDLLWILGTSPKPLTTYQIKEKLEEKKELEKTNSPYVYEMIKNLHIGFKDSHFRHLFDWNKLPKDKYNKQRLLNYLRGYLNIDLDYYDNIQILNNNNIIKIDIDSDKQIIMKKKSVFFVDVIYINKGIQEKSFSFLIKNKHQICIPSFTNKNTLESFFNLFYNKKILFLDKELKPKYHDLINQKKTTYRQLSKKSSTAKELNQEIEEIFMNNRLYVYSLNIRGLILYILAEIENEKRVNCERFNAKTRKIKYNSQISKVIENLAKYYSTKFPFLYNYIEMRNLISKIDDSTHSEKHYESKILRKITEELKHQIHFDEMYSNLDLDSNSNNMINYWLTKRYFNEISYYFAYLYQFLDDETKKEFIHLFRDYQKQMLTLMKEYLDEEQKSIRNLLSEYESHILLIS